MALHNELFGDDVTVLGALRHSNDQISLVISQTFLVGRRPGRKEVEDFMESYEFQPLRDGASFYRWTDGLAVFDAHSGNFVFTSDGLVPFDVIPIQVKDTPMDRVLWRLIQ